MSGPATVPLLSLEHVLGQVRACDLCRQHLPLGPRPVLVAEASARLLIVGQAPGTRVHHTGIPWNDPSGDRLRQWLGLDRAQFYDARRIAIMPMGFCYPGSGPSGDLPPRPECAPRWHALIRAQLPSSTKRVQSTYIIDNDADRPALERRTREVWDALVARSTAA